MNFLINSLALVCESKSLFLHHNGLLICYFINIGVFRGNHTLYKEL